jgi:hypothetical protein
MYTNECTYNIHDGQKEKTVEVERERMYIGANN